MKVNGDLSFCLTSLPFVFQGRNKAVKVQPYEGECIMTGFSFEVNYPSNTAYFIYKKEMLVTVAKASLIVQSRNAPIFEHY